MEYLVWFFLASPNLSKEEELHTYPACQISHCKKLQHHFTNNFPSS